MAPLRPVEEPDLRRLDFPALLVALHGLLGEPIEISIYLPGGSFSAGWEARLIRATGLPPDGVALAIEFDPAPTLTLAPEEVAVFSGRSFERAGITEWIEIQIHCGPCVLIEPGRARRP